MGVERAFARVFRMALRAATIGRLGRAGDTVRLLDGRAGVVLADTEQTGFPARPRMDKVEAFRLDGRLSLVQIPHSSPQAGGADTKLSTC